MVEPAAPQGAFQAGMHVLVSRTGLMKRMETGSTGPVSLVVAPAGSGKTVLVRSWLGGRKSTQRVAWVTVERGERDAQHFWSTLVSELRVAELPGVALDELAPAPSYEAEASAKRLVADLASLKRRFVLVIDDLHELASADAQGALTYLIDHLPRGVHIVLISRRDPQLGLHRRQLEGALTEIRDADLRFSLDETAEMLSSAGIVLSQESLELLQARTEGWIAGLRLAAISLAKHPRPDDFVLQFSGSERTVAEYLLAEVLESQPADVRRLLMRASLLERVNGSLGDLLTDSSDSEQLLQALATGGGFVVALDPQRTWFRFHHLFADLLAVELRHTEPEEIPRLHLAAANWLSDHGEVIQAIVHAQAGGNRDLASELLIEHYFSLMLDGRQETAHGLLEAFATDSVTPAPEAAVVLANEQLAEGSLDQAAAYLELADRDADVVPGTRRHRFDMALLVTRLSLARRVGDFRSVLDRVQSARDLIVEPRDRRDLSMNNDVRALILMNLGIVQVWSGHDEDAVQQLTAASELAAQIRRPYLQISCQAHLAQAMSGRSFTHARQAAREAISLAESHGWGSDPVIGPALVTLGASLLQAGRLNEGEDALDRAGQTMHAELEPAVGFMLCMARGAAEYARGRHSKALESYRAAERMGHLLITDSPLAVQLRCATLLAIIGLGELGIVREQLAKMSKAERATGETREVLGALALAEDEPAAAVEALAPTLAGEADVHHVLVVIRSLLREALACDALDEPLGVESAVERALDLAEQDTLILPFMFIETRELLEHHPHHRTGHGAFIAEILDVLAGGPPVERMVSNGVVEPLSGAELRVLRFLPTNLPATAIADEIYVSVNTVKTHMRHIYAKLDAHSRVEAVARAREVGLLGHSARHG